MAGPGPQVTVQVDGRAAETFTTKSAMALYSAVEWAILLSAEGPDCYLLPTGAMDLMRLSYVKSGGFLDQLA